MAGACSASTDGPNIEGNLDARERVFVTRSRRALVGELRTVDRIFEGHARSVLAMIRPVAVRVVFAEVAVESCGVGLTLVECTVAKSANAIFVEVITRGCHAGNAIAAVAPFLAIAEDAVTAQLSIQRARIAFALICDGVADANATLVVQISTAGRFRSDAITARATDINAGTELLVIAQLAFVDRPRVDS